MYYKLDNNEFEMIQKAGKRNFTDYETVGNFIPVESLLAVIEDLLGEIETLEERYNDLENDLEDNYKPIPVDLGLSDRDFY